MRVMSNIFNERTAYKPFAYPECFDMWLEHEKMHWIGREVPLHDDLRDWHHKLDEGDHYFLNNAFRLFTQSDIDVAGGYINSYLPHFKHPEVRMMLLGFAAREAVHIDAYTHLTETLGMSDSFYSEFLDVPVMKAKHDFFESVMTPGSSLDVLPLKIAGISAFTEGMFLFSTFVMLLAYPRAGTMKGMGQIVSWSILDEQMHVKGLIYLFRKIIEENPHLWNDDLKSEIYSTAHMMTELEDDFIDVCYGDFASRRGLSKDDLKQYNRYIVDRRLNSMGLKAIHFVEKNPLPWVDQMVNSQNHENFFETRATSYAKGALSGSFGDVWGRKKRD